MGRSLQTERLSRCRRFQRGFSSRAFRRAMLALVEDRLRYGEGNYECLEWSRKVVGDPQRQSAAHLSSKPD